MRKSLKIFLISLGSLILLLGITVSIVLWLVFTPEKITPIAKKQAGKYLNCQTDIGKVELTFFSTFPNFGLKVDRLMLINPTPEAPCDTLLNLNRLNCTVDIMALWKKNELIVRDLYLSDGEICAFIDSQGNSNLDILPASESQSDGGEEGFTLNYINTENVILKNIHLSYTDLSSGIKADINRLNTKISGSMKGENIRANVAIEPMNIVFEYGGEQFLDIRNFSGQIQGKVNDGKIHADVNVNPFNITYQYGNDAYLKDAKIALNTSSDIVWSRQYIQLNKFLFSINEMPLTLNGSIENKGNEQGILTDLTYSLASWSIEEMMQLIPDSYQSYVNGMTAGGILSSEGKIKGTYTAENMPFMDVRVELSEGKFRSAELLPFPLSNIDTDLKVYTDLRDDAASYVHINHMKANTPKSSLATTGRINQLFSDIHADLQSTLHLNFSELKPFIPKDMKVSAKGEASGEIKTDVTVDQLQKMALEKMILSGTLLLTNVDATYDSLAVKTNRTRIDFALPAHMTTLKKATFASAEITSEELCAHMLNSFNARLQDAAIAVETSDIRDTTKMPSLFCTFKLNRVTADMDTIRLAVDRPAGSITLTPQLRKADKPKINLVYNSGSIQANMGSDFFQVENLDLNTDVTYNSEQKDIFLKWKPQGHIRLENGEANISGLSYPIEIPAVKTEFTPNEFAIEDVAVKVGESDFRLAGKLENILSYYRKDSILRGDFQFLSANTSITQLMNMTNGIGSTDEHKNTESDGSDTLSGPYMVPRNMDILLHTNIKQATFGIDTLSNIRGDVRAHNGTLVVDDLLFSTPAADMQLTAIYRTPRKNHLYVGLDFHMLEVEIHELLNMIPEIDSIMPMLRSFGGKGEFHVAAETYLDSLYRIKMSTIRGASSIRGENLVLMDGETFSEIAKKLKFSKKAENKVDSLSAEFTLFSNEVDVYPFLVSMDKYKAVVSGRHNLDMSFNYNISVVQSPLPFRLAVDVSGTLEKLKFRLAKSKYPEFYRPASRKIVENKQMELRQLIRNALVKKVVTQDE